MDFGDEMTKKGAVSFYPVSRSQLAAPLLFAGILIGTLPPSASAQQIDAPPLAPAAPGKTESKMPDVSNGNILARKLCATCHLIGEPADGPMPSDVPSFSSIANRRGQSADHLSTWLTRPHPPMPNLNLTRIEIRDLTGYILSLRGEQ